MEEQKSNAGQGLAIAGLILGIIAIPLAMMGCTSILGLILGATGIILSAVGLSQATKSNGNRGLPISGLVVSILGTVIALMWMLFIARFAAETGKWWKKEGIQIIEDIEQEFGGEIEEAFGEIGEDLEEIGRDLEETLEDLEWDDIDWDKYDTGEPVPDEEFNKIMNSYESLMEDYVDLAEKSDQGDVIVIAEMAKVSAKAVALAARITAIGDNMSESQLEEFEKLQEKYKEVLEELEEEN